MPEATSSSNREPENSSLRKGLTSILSEYVAARARETLDSGHHLWSVARKLQCEFNELPSVRVRPNLIVRWSFGQGAWARVPWLSLLDQRETKTTTVGVYVIYLFRQDMSGVYLTLNQGVTKEKESRGVKDGRAFVRQRAIELRGLCNPLAPIGFSLKDDIDLHTDGPLGLDYQLGTITHKFYEAGSIPADASLANDLQHLLTVYDNFLVKKLSVKRW